jgi:hypothetical protein
MFMACFGIVRGCLMHARRASELGLIVQNAVVQNAVSHWLRQSLNAPKLNIIAH